jgi:hypothetical protein
MNKPEFETEINPANKGEARLKNQWRYERTQHAFPGDIRKVAPSKAAG